MINNIFLTDEYEKSSDEILQYLTYYNASFKRIHPENLISDLSINLSNEKKDIIISFDNANVVLGLDNNSKLFFRRGDFSFQHSFPKIENFDNKVYRYLDQEWFFVKKYLHRTINGIGDYYSEIDSNKLIDLENAKKVGLKIPSTLVTTLKSDLAKFIKKFNIVVSKPIHNSHLSFEFEQKYYSGKGIVLLNNNSDVFINCSEQFSLSLFQEYIYKQFEVRVFFINEELYPMAIFSQLDEKTKFDYRNYNDEKPNRNVPIKLPDEVAKKIIKFNEVSNLDTGSIDLIYTNQKEFVFLEVNPVGQFGWVSKNCNYYLEKRIALKLINK